MTVDIEPTTLPAVRALSEPLRWRIVELLADEELCVCHIVEELAVPQPLVSHHLRILRDAGLVETERYRYWTYYRLRPGALAPLRDRLERMVSSSSAPGERRRPCC
jgi:ArsR family transcriptional regulator, arsenate/arsenite/antimonite-responsive transcriptional repressor